MLLILAGYQIKVGEKIVKFANENWDGEKKWANAITEDDSYWVWIPRYEYKLTQKTEGADAGKIEVKFIPTTVTEADTTGYKVHPAFKKCKIKIPCL